MNRGPTPPVWPRGSAHQQMSVAGKREGITRADFNATGRQCGVATVPKLNAVIDQVTAALGQWGECAAEAGGFPPTTRQRLRALEAQAVVSGVNG